jgi:hypothetical protein
MERGTEGIKAANRRVGGSAENHSTLWTPSRKRSVPKRIEVDGFIHIVQPAAMTAFGCTVDHLGIELLSP